MPIWRYEVQYPLIMIQDSKDWSDKPSISNNMQLFASE